MIRHAGQWAAALGLSLALGVPVQAESLKSAVQAAVTENPTARVRNADVQATTPQVMTHRVTAAPNLGIWSSANSTTTSLETITLSLSKSTTRRPIRSTSLYTR